MLIGPDDYSENTEDFCMPVPLMDSPIGVLLHRCSPVSPFSSAVLGYSGSHPSLAREISIRKVLGASVLGLWKLLLIDFLVLVGIAVVVALPGAWYLSLKWLQQYGYRDDPSWMVFMLTGVLALVITIVTVSFQTVKASLANPVRALKSE